jgi:hypothetical protein
MVTAHKVSWYFEGKGLGHKAYLLSLLKAELLRKDPGHRASTEGIPEKPSHSFKNNS